MATPKTVLNSMREQLLNSEDAALVSIGELATDRQLDMLFQVVNHYTGNLNQHSGADLFEQFLRLDRWVLSNEIKRINNNVIARGKL